MLTWLHAKVITPFHILDQAKAASLPVTPGSGTTRTVFEWTNGLVPLPAALDGVSFQVISTRETEEFL